MTKKDESPEEATNPYWSDELLAVLAEALGDEDRARQTLEDIIQQAQEGKATRTLSTERLASYLTELYGRIAEGVRRMLARVASLTRTACTSWSTSTRRRRSQRPTRSTSWKGRR